MGVSGYMDVGDACVCWVCVTLKKKGRGLSVLNSLKKRGRSREEDCIFIS